MIAIDWSGAIHGVRRSMWLAEVRGDRLVRLESGRSREDVRRHLVEEAGRDPGLIVGLDFAFSLPAWFLEERGITTARELWHRVELEGEEWLARGDPPFWGRPGRRRPHVPGHFRRTDTQTGRFGSSAPQSVFQIGGAGQVGTGSIRGMPLLAHLSATGFSVWPFDPPRMPLVVEIYPRALTGPVVKSRREAREDYLARTFPQLDARLRDRASESDSSFDAAVSALVMSHHVDEILALPVAADPTVRLEGEIWRPAAARA